ncbi:MAG TPA: diphosphomevalonate decarboxylase, partial [Flexilinea sp.]|nr:diphosphomevalonate decarboxylase [Flexilinea sp.]
MSDSVATAVAHPNIAFIKYWGNRDDSLRLPANGSISMNLGTLETRTTVAFSSAYRSDRVSVNGSLSEGESLIRVVHFMDRIRSLAGEKRFAEIESRNNFPIGAGIASSAAAFAALALAGSAAAGLHLNEAELSRLARLGSGS